MQYEEILSNLKWITHKLKSTPANSPHTPLTRADNRCLGDQNLTWTHKTSFLHAIWRPIEVAPQSSERAHITCKYYQFEHIIWQSSWTSSLAQQDYYSFDFTQIIRARATITCKIISKSAGARLDIIHLRVDISSLVRVISTRSYLPWSIIFSSITETNIHLDQVKEFSFQVQSTYC